jgi:hypothetical protein
MRNLLNTGRISTISTDAHLRPAWRSTILLNDLLNGEGISESDALGQNRGQPGRNVASVCKMGSCEGLGPHWRKVMIEGGEATPARRRSIGSENYVGTDLVRHTTIRVRTEK